MRSSCYSSGYIGDKNPNEMGFFQLPLFGPTFAQVWLFLQKALPCHLPQNVVFASLLNHANMPKNTHIFFQAIWDYMALGLISVVREYRVPVQILCLFLDFSKQLEDSYDSITCNKG